MFRKPFRFLQFHNTVMRSLNMSKHFRFLVLVFLLIQLAGKLFSLNFLLPGICLCCTQSFLLFILKTGRQECKDIFQFRFLDCWRIFFLFRSWPDFSNLEISSRNLLQPSVSQPIMVESACSLSLNLYYDSYLN